MIAICIGHSRGDGGAVSTGGVNEWAFNRDLGARVLRILRERGQEAVLVDRYPAGGYGSAMDWLAEDLKSMGATVAVELHFNAAGVASAHGHEWLHWHSSVAGRRLAQCLDRRMCEAFPALRRRGLVAIRQEKERGGGFLRKTPCPAVICEPFFGTNRVEWDFYSARRDELAQVMADGMDDWRGKA